MSSAVHEAFSTFRDPAGQLTLTNDHAVRIVRRDYADAAREFIGSALYSKWATRGDMVATEVLSRYQVYSRRTGTRLPSTTGLPCASTVT